MSKPITNAMLIKKFSEVNRKVRLRDKITASNNVTTANPDTIDSIVCVVEKVVRVEGDTLITDTGRRGKLFNPMPCLHWKCLTTGNLRKPFNALFLYDGVNNYCVGVDGASDEFEVRFQVGTNEVRLNNLFLNMVAPTIARNGVEVKEDAQE